MSRVGSFILVFATVILDITTIYAWHATLFPTEPTTVFASALQGAMMMFFSLVILGVNALIFKVALAEES